MMPRTHHPTGGFHEDPYEGPQRRSRPEPQRQEARGEDAGALRDAQHEPQREARSPLTAWAARTATRSFGCTTRPTTRSRRRYREAEPLLRRAVAIAERSFGPRSAELAGALNHLGVLYKYMGRFPDASRAYARALRIAKRLYGASHPTLATLAHNLGGL